MAFYRDIFALCVLFFASAFGSAIPENVEPKDISQGRYLISQALLTQAEAISYCNTNGARELSAVESSLEQNEVQQILDITAGSAGYIGDAWLSGQPLDFNTKTYVWASTGQNVLYNNLISGADAGMTEMAWRQKGIALHQNFQGDAYSNKWILRDATDKLLALCER